MTVEADRPWTSDYRGGAGFTLIEVIGALVIFSVGVLMVMRVGSALTTQMRYAGARSEIVVLANERLDSIEAVPFASLSAGTTTDSLMVQGWAYQRIAAITSITPVLARIEVTLSRLGGAGPTFHVTSYVSGPW